MNPASGPTEPSLPVHELLATLIRFSSRKTVAAKLGVVPKTLSRWTNRETEPPPFLDARLRELLHPVPSHPGPKSTRFRFIDLFAGIGGFRLGFEKHGGECVFTSEWDRHSQATYWANFAPSHGITGDITKVDEKEVPDHEILLAGFPCQPFSLAGVSKKNALGRPHGFLDETQGTLFFDVARIIAEKRPKAFVLENVKNLVGHDGGKTFDVICRNLSEKLGYKIYSKVINASYWVPQHRQRIFIVGFDGLTAFSWDDLKLPKTRPKLGSILHPEDGSETPEVPYTTEEGKVDPRYILTTHLWKYLRDYAERHAAAGHGFGFGRVGPDDIARTLSARYHKDGSEILISRGRRNPRRLTPRECARLMGFDSPRGSKFRIPVSDTQSYRQFGNAVVVPVVEAVGEIVVPNLLDLMAGVAPRRQLQMTL